MEQLAIQFCSVGGPLAFCLVWLGRYLASRDKASAEEMKRKDEVFLAEMKRRDEAFTAEMRRRDEAQAKKEETYRLVIERQHSEVITMGKETNASLNQSNVTMSTLTAAVERLAGRYREFETA